MAQLELHGRADLDGTHRAVIETDLPELESLLKSPGGSITRYVKLAAGDKVCGCIVGDAKRGGANRLYVDRFKQLHLGLRDGAPVAIEPFDLPAAEKVELLVPADFSDDDLARFVGKPVAKKEKMALYTFAGQARPVTVADVRPGDLTVIVAATEIVTSKADAASPGAGGAGVPLTYKDIGGLGREIRLIREVVEYPLRFPQLFDHLGVSQPRGIILHGPPGTGKTLIAKALANEVGATFLPISGPEVYSKWYGQTEERLRNLFEEAGKHAPAIILMDELDSLAPKRDQVHGEQEQRTVATLLTLMDGLKQLKGVVVVGTTNRINSIDLALRREGRFGHEVHIGVPDARGRREILDIHTRRMPLDGVDLDVVAQKTVGYVGADLAALCREAAYGALRRSFPPEAFEKGKVVTPEGLSVTQADFEAALPSTPPSAMREFLIEIPNVSWEDIGGLDAVKKLLVENIGYAITRPEVFKKVGVKPAKGILLYGPPGGGKTLLAKAVARQCGANFISVKGPELRSKWFGESEERIRFLFTKAREAAPCVVFFDEMDAATPARGRDTSGVTDSIVNQILSEIDGIESAEGVFIIGATNRPELLDQAILRPGRFDYHVEVPLPDASARKSILGVHLRGKPLGPGVEVDALVAATEGFSGAELAEVCRDAAWQALRDGEFEADRVAVTMDHLLAAAARVRATRGKLTPKPLGFAAPREEEARG